MSSPDHPAIAIIGPTACGKSELALSLALELGGEIVSCDALQVYRHMNIGTAKPTPAEHEMVPHHMLDLREPHQDFSAGDYQRIGRETLRDIAGRGRLPFVAGGTGFYLRALIDGLFEGPGRSEELRTRMRRIIERRGAAFLHRRLQRADPATAARIAPADASRTVRAYEMLLLTRKPMGWWQKQERNALHGFRWLKLGLAWPRERLYERINLRVEQMFRSGLVDEVRGLLDRYARSCHAFKAIGYRQVIEHLEGKIPLARAVTDTQKATRNYAKRQLTWFRSDREVIWLDAAGDFAVLRRAAAGHVRDFLRNF